MEKRISGKTGLLGLIGSPVGHSASPAMYNYSFEKLGLDYAYLAFDIKVEQVKDAVAAMRTLHMRGCNVTMPDKTEAAKYMDELSPAAQIIGAVNTIVNDDGKLTGHITKGEGFVQNLRDHLGLVVADAVYNPEETRLLREAKEAGCTCIGGKGMLLWQGVAAFKLYTGMEMPVEDVKKLFFS